MRVSCVSFLLRRRGIRKPPFLWGGGGASMLVRLWVRPGLGGARGQLADGFSWVGWPAGRLVVGAGASEYE